jgi:hypothetical protein
MSIKRTFAALVFICIAGTSVLHAQQQPSKKTPATKGTTKKPVAKKKPGAKKPANVFICDGVGGYFYHSHAACAALKKCKGKVLSVSKQQATGQYSCKPCKKCF